MPLHAKFALTALAAACAVVTTGCSHQHTAAAPLAASKSPAAAVAPAPVAMPATPPRPHAYFRPTTTTDRLMGVEDPRGSGPAIALRFLRALQAGDDLAAAKQLVGTERLFLALRSDEHLALVMGDVMANAELAGAAPCTYAVPLSREAAVVSCGTQHVVVHVRTGLLPGVQISSYFPHNDVYLGPHTHAYTNYAV